MPLEDFTTYVEVDPNNHIEKTATHIDFRAYRNEDAYVYKDRGAGHFTDFEHLIDVRAYFAPAGATYSAGYLLSVDTVDDMKGMNDALKTFICFQINASTADIEFYLVEYYGGTSYASSAYKPGSGVWRYLKIIKSGTSLQCKIYSDPARTNLLATLSLTLHANHSFRYVFACNTYNDGVNYYNDNDIENLDLKEGVAHTVTVTEQLGMVDSVAAPGTLHKVVTDQLGLKDTVAAPGTLHLTVAEQLGMLDSLAFPIRVTIMESLGLVDSVAKRADLKQSVLESLGLLDTAPVRRGLHQTITEQLGLLDSAVPRYLIGRIPDLIDHRVLAGAPEFLDLPDNVEAAYVSVKNTWQDAENLDAEHGYVSYVWIPEETFKVRIMKLHVYAEKFRAYSKAAAAGGAQVVTSVAAGKHRHKMFDWLDETPGGWSLNEFRAYDEFGYLRRIDLAVDVSGRDLHTYEEAADHTHDVSLPNHTHPIDFGIYEEAITGRTLSAKLYDPDNQLVKDFGVILTGESDLILDLSEYFETLKYGMYRLELSASARLRARLVYYELCLMYAY